MDKYQVEANFCKGGRNCQSSHTTGTWSTVYDQSFKIELDNGMRFLANFKYSLKPTISADPAKETDFKKLDDLKTGDYAKFNSECDKTMIGFVQNIPEKSSEVYSMTNHKISCFYGIQDTHYDMEKTVSVRTESDSVKVAVITQQNKIQTKPIEQIQLQTDQNVKLGQV